MWYVHEMECDSTLKKDMLTQVTTRMSLESIMPSAISQSRKDYIRPHDTTNGSHLESVTQTGSRRGPPGAGRSENRGG